MPDQTPPARFAVRHENAWGFAVYEVATDKVVEIDGMRQDMMLRPEADRLAANLNRDPDYRPAS